MVSENWECVTLRNGTHLTMGCDGSWNNYLFVCKMRIGALALVALALTRVELSHTAGALRNIIWIQKLTHTPTPPTPSQVLNYIPQSSGEICREKY